MAFTLQDDTGNIPGANAYIDVARFKAYHDDRGRTTNYGAATDDQIKASIVLATAYLDGRFTFIGWRNQPGRQSTQWPRYNAVDSDNDYVTGIPDEVKDATAEYALRALPGVLLSPSADTLIPDPTSDASGALVSGSSVKVGPIEEKLDFSAGGAYSMPDYPYADNILKKRGLIETGRTLVRA